MQTFMQRRNKNKMCGIIIKSGDTNSLKILYEKQKSRGSDGAGIFWTQPNNVIAYKVSDIDGFFNELDNGNYGITAVPEWDNLSEEDKTIIGKKYLYKDIKAPYIFHHRKRSMGTVITDLNHPFLFERGSNCERTYI